MTDQQLAAIARTSITTSDAPPDLIVPAAQRADEWLADPTICGSRRCSQPPGSRPTANDFALITIGLLGRRIFEAGGPQNFHGSFAGRECL
jgi:hypothetical protein